MYSLQTRSGGPYILQAFLKTTTELRISHGFGMDLHLAYIQCATGKAWFYENDIL